mmetsp:Transcript_106557/g.339896  ORF Transcript_106557/g.339896 Transcript_106557/m.339896 type:complete len:237 (-) Transcript_106557:709-1419(-)
MHRHSAHSSVIMEGRAFTTLMGKTAIGRSSDHRRTPILPDELRASVTRPDCPLNFTDFRPTSKTGCPTRNGKPPTISSTGLSGQGATAPPPSGGDNAAPGEEADIEDEAVGGSGEVFISESTSASRSPRRSRTLAKHSTNPAFADAIKADVWSITKTVEAESSSLTCAVEIRLVGLTGSVASAATARGADEATASILKTKPASNDDCSPMSFISSPPTVDSEQPKGFVAEHTLRSY